MIVCKFGGTSLADAGQIRKACSIIRSHPDRKIVVVSAPGKRAGIPGDIKITDRLIALCHDLESCSASPSPQFAAVSARFVEICRGLGLSENLSSDLLTELSGAAGAFDSEKPWTRADVIAMGEIASARIAAAFLCASGSPARVVDPRRAGLLLSSVNGATQILPETYKNLEFLKKANEIAVIPGFFGTSPDGHTTLFSRGGSDITGSVAAAAAGADRYENWTDRDSVFAVNPDILERTAAIPELSYHEMRELAYIGFPIIHPEALEPVIRHRIPAHIRNTNHPEAPGTMILPERTHISRTITGIAASDHFCLIRLCRPLIIQETGILSKILRLFSDEDINVHYVPSGIDSVRVVARDDALTPEKELRLQARLDQELEISRVDVVRDQSVVMLVGEGMRDAAAVLSRASGALACEKISIGMVLLDSFENSLLFTVRGEEKNRAVSALYRTFFENDNDEEGLEK